MRAEKAKFKVIVYFIFLIFISYKLFVFFLLVGIFFKVIEAVLMVKSSRQEKRLWELKRELYHIASRTYDKDADLRERSNTFYYKNKDVFKQDYSYHIYLGFVVAVVFFSRRSLGTSIIMVLTYLVEQNIGANKPVSNMTLK